MKSNRLFLITSLAAALAFHACSDKEEDPAPGGGGTDKCAGKTITVTADVTAAVKCDNDGKLTLHARGSSGFTYKLGTGAFQADSVFSNLSAGTITVTVKDADGCTKDATFTVTETGSKGPTFTPVASLISAKCNLACHTAGTGGAPMGIFSTDCNIVSRSAMIKTKAYDGNMGNLDGNEKNLILTWINAGGGYTD